MHAKRKAPRAPFIVTVAAILLPGCGPAVTSNPPFLDCPDAPPAAGDACDAGLTCSYLPCEEEYVCNDSGQWESVIVSCNPPPPAECPESIPLQNDNCPEEGMSCTYPDECGGELTATCAGFGDLPQWDVDIAPPCNPPACPAELPNQGDACAVPDQLCSYEVDIGCGPQTMTATCDGGAWLIDSGPTCNPPPPSPCSGLNEAECGADATCRWLTPGCSEPPLPGAGCFPLEPCANNLACGPASTCQEVAYNPCYMQACDACAAFTSVCLSP